MKGSETPRSLPKENLFYLYEGPKDLHEPLNKARQGICSTYMKGPETSKSLLTGNLFYLYEGLRDPQKPPKEEFVLPI